MRNVRAKAKSKKAELEARRAAAEAREAIADLGRASRELAAALGESVRSTNLEQRAGELADRLRGSELYHRGSDLAADVASNTQRVAADTQKRLRDAKLDERAAELAALLRSSDVVNRLRSAEMAARAQRSTDEALGRTGAWLASGRTGEKLGVRTKPRLPAWLLAAMGVLVGYLVGTLTAPRKGQYLREELATSAQRLQQDTRDTAAPPSQKPLADKIRTRLGEDPRTSSLPRLNINVAEGTAFIRGTVPPGYDERAIREIAGSVEGIKDVDLQVTVTA